MFECIYLIIHTASGKVSHCFTVGNFSLIHSTCLSEIWVSLKNNQSLQSALLSALYCEGFSWWLFIPSFCLIYLTFSHSALAHIRWQWQQGVYAGHLSSLAKHMPPTSLTCMSLQKWNGQTELDSLILEPNHWTQNCLTFIILRLSISRIHSTASVYVCVWAHLGEAEWHFHWYRVHISTHRAILSHISSSSWSCEARSCIESRTSMWTLIRCHCHSLSV